MKIKKKANVKLTVYVPLEMRKQIEKFGKKTKRNLSDAMQYLLDTHQDLQPQTKEPKQVQTA